MEQSTATETPQAFAARYWGGEGILPFPREADYGPMACDGGSVHFPAGWAFFADGQRYRVHQRPEDGRWEMNVGYEGFGIFHRDGDEWVVDHGWSREVRRVAAR